MWELSGYNKVAPQWAIHYSLTYTSWSQFQELKATNSNGQTLFYKDESFRCLPYRAGYNLLYGYNWTFRTGIAFDDSPVPADKRSISIPDQDRFWLSAGATYAFNEDALSTRASLICTVKKLTSRKGRMSSLLKVKPGCWYELQLRVLIATGIKKVSIAHLFISLESISFNSFSMAFAFGFSSGFSLPPLAIKS
jgi:long-chain fatty acid transport protein